MNDERLPDEQVKVKMSVCSVCNGWVRVATAHHLDAKERNEFAREAMKYNLAIREIPLLEFRASDIPMCMCKK